MLPSAVDAIRPAFQHTKQQLFRPFRFGQWTRLALVGLFAGEMSSGGGCNFQMPNTAGTAHRDFASSAFPGSPAFGILLAAILITVPVLWLAFLYLSSRMRFVLFDSVVEKRCELRRMWHARRAPAVQYFVWQIAFSLITLACLATVVGVPVFFAFVAGWFTSPREHLAALIPAGLLVLMAFLGILLLSLVVHVFTKDFVVPQMALESISAFDGWRRLWNMLRVEKAGYAGYAGMKLVMAIGAAFAVAMLSIVIIIILLIPFGGLGAITVLVGHAAGMGLNWNVFTVTVAIVAGSTFLLALFYAISLVSVPVIVFFPAFSIYFFSSRYPQLASLIYPPPPILAPPTVSPEPAV